VNEYSAGRRSLVSGIGAAVAAVAVGVRPARAQAPTGSFKPARHPKDAWLNDAGGKHRVIIDCATPDGAGEGLLYAGNLYTTNKAAYEIDAKDLAIVVCLRHFATVFAYNDTIWGKYGKAFSDLLHFTDPKTKAAPSTNLYNSADYGLTLPNFGNTIGSVVANGTQFAVCDLATTFIAGQLATAAQGDAKAIHDELVANLIPNSHLVSAGVIATTRAQEYGYALLTAL
jgi:hypothetical protein